MKKTHKFWILIGVGIALSLIALAVLSLGFEHLYCWYQQPIFLGPEGVEGKSLGFLITASFFFGGALIFGAIGAVLIILGLHSNKKSPKKKKA